MGRVIGTWIYQNSGGYDIEQRLIKKLQDREIKTISNLNLSNAFVTNGLLCCTNKDEFSTKLNQIDLFFSYNAGEQNDYQMYLYKALDKIIPTINNYQAFELTEDKFQTSFLLRNSGITTAEYELCFQNNRDYLEHVMSKWNKMVCKPTDGFGGAGITKIDTQSSIDMLTLMLQQMNLKNIYIEKFIDYDNTDYRIDIVNGKLVSCYGRKARDGGWKTNIGSGGSVFLREANDDVVNLAIKATQITGLEIAGVDIIYDREKEEYIVLEVNGIPAFATPEQEKLGLDFNDKKIDIMVDLIDRKTKK